MNVEVKTTKPEIEAVVLTLTPRELILLAVSNFRHTDGHIFGIATRETVTAGLDEAFKAIVGKSVARSVHTMRGQDADVAEAIAVKAGL